MASKSGDARERMPEVLVVMTRAWTATRLDYKVKCFTVRRPELRPVPVDLAASRRTASFRWCGEKAVPILTVRSLVAQISPRLGEYASALEVSGLDAGRRQGRA